MSSQKCGNGVVLARVSIVISSFCWACNAHTANSVSRNAVPLNIGLRRVRIIFLCTLSGYPTRHGGAWHDLRGRKEERGACANRSTHSPKDYPFRSEAKTRLEADSAPA